MIPFAPDRLSTMTGVPKDSESFWVIRRPKTSAGPPAGKGTTSLIGFVGYDCANAPMPHNPEVSNVLTANTACTNRYAASLSDPSVFGMLPPRAMLYGESMPQEKVTDPRAGRRRRRAYPSVGQACIRDRTLARTAHAA